MDDKARRRLSDLHQDAWRDYQRAYDRLGSIHAHFSSANTEPLRLANAEVYRTWRIYAKLTNAMTNDIDRAADLAMCQAKTKRGRACRSNNPFFLGLLCGDIDPVDPEVHFFCFRHGNRGSGVTIAR